MEFNLRAQFDLLRELGIDSPGWEHLGWAFALGMVLWIAWVALTLRRSVARVKPDRIGRAWLRATRKLAKVAPPRTASEGPLDYAQRVAAARPDLAAPVKALAAHYARLRFGPAANAAEVTSLRTRSQAAGGVSRTRHSNTPPITNSNTSETIEARSLCVSAATTAMSNGPSTVANLPIML